MKDIRDKIAEIMDEELVFDCDCEFLNTKEVADKIDNLYRNTRPDKVCKECEDGQVYVGTVKGMEFHNPCPSCSTGVEKGEVKG